MRLYPGMLVVVPWLVLAPGCATNHGVRYVYQDGDYGVVGIPENTDRWPTFYRRQAERLMAEHFPEGHAIVRAEEVVEWSRTLTLQGTNTAELLPQLPTDLIRVGKLGLTSSRSQADTLKIKECRIIYRRIPNPELAGGFTEVATLTPTQYLDPNEAERHRLAKGASDKEKPGDAKEGSPAAGEPAKEPAHQAGPDLAEPPLSYGTGAEAPPRPQPPRARR